MGLRNRGAVCMSADWVKIKPAPWRLCCRRNQVPAAWPFSTKPVEQGASLTKKKALATVEGDPPQAQAQADLASNGVVDHLLLFEHLDVPPNFALCQAEWLRLQQLERVLMDVADARAHRLGRLVAQAMPIQRSTPDGRHQGAPDVHGYLRDLERLLLYEPLSTLPSASRICSPPTSPRKAREPAA